MNTGKLFMFKNFQENKQHEYLGSDGLSLSQSYNLYAKKCFEFKAKVKKYADSNLILKNSLLGHCKSGYESSEQFEEEIIVQREEQKKDYKKAFDVTAFDEDQDSMYECFRGQSKRIRVIRKISTDNNEVFSEDFDMKKMGWFTRYCTMSKFIQAARTIIIQNRLKGKLTIFKSITPKIVRSIEQEIKREQDEYAESTYEDSEQEEESISVSDNYPCRCFKGNRNIKLT